MTRVLKPLDLQALYIILCIKVALVTEPAMGSAAFLNEATSQLAEAYLTAKEKELRRTVPHDQRVQELQRIKMYIADRNVYGIDLNPIAVELAEVSLWLNSIYQGGYVPWFRTQINNGNSLIGARRQCYHIKQLSAEKGGQVWYNNAPERIEPGQKRKFSTQVYHFLLGDPGMCNYTDKVIKELEPEKIDKIKKWNKDFCKPLTEMEIDQLVELSSAIDKLWDEHIQVRKEIDEKTTDPLTVWGQPEDTEHKHMTIREKDRIYDELYLSAHQQNAGPYARLKAAMDYWCALWFWPIDQADELPTRQQFIFDMYALLGVNIVNASGMKRKKHSELSTVAYQTSFLDNTFFDDMVDRFETLGVVNLDHLREKSPQLRIADEIANGKLLKTDTDKAGLIHEIREGGQHFFHWELEFADVFQERGGFDLVVGNPPWIKLEWDETNVLGDHNPIIYVRKTKNSEITQEQRSLIIHNETTRRIYFSEYESITGHQRFFNSISNYPLLKGQQANLFKCFFPQAWEYNKSNSVTAFVHPKSVFDDPSGNILRKSMYQYLRYHFHFINKEQVFTDVSTSREFGLSVFVKNKKFGFDLIGNLVGVETIDSCYEENKDSPIPNMFDSSGKWNHAGHPDRIIHITEKELKTMASIYDEKEWSGTQLLIIHLNTLMATLRLFANQEKNLDSMGDDLFTTELFEETSAVKKDIIRKEVHFPMDTTDLVYSGANIGLSNPIYKVARANCESRYDFDPVDLTYINDKYLQRCKYKPSTNSASYISPRTGWGSSYLDEYRCVSRRMLNKDGERTLLACIIPPKAFHIDTVFGMAMKNGITAFAGFEASLPYDFFVKITRKSDARRDTLAKLPIFDDYSLLKEVVVRALLLNALNTEYAALWEHEWDDSFREMQWSKYDRRLSINTFKTLEQKWSWNTPLRSDFERRQALIELDVLSALALGMTLDQLITIYRVQFPVLRKIDIDTWYDVSGRIVFTSSTNLPGVGFDRPTFEKSNMIMPVERGSDAWNGIMKDAPAGYVFERTITDDTQPGGPVERTIRYYAPFDRCDREKDYETAWEFFCKRSL